MPQYDIFISHASKDKEAYVEKLKLGIEAAKITVFYDEVKWVRKTTQKKEQI